MLCALFIVFFQAEDGIRDATVTGVQTCALPICDKGLFTGLAMPMTIRARPTGAIAMSMQNVASPAISLNPPKRNLLAHIPGDEGSAVMGRTLAILSDPIGEVERMAATSGLVLRSR